MLSAGAWIKVARPAAEPMYKCGSSSLTSNNNNNFNPIANESLGSFSESALNLFLDLCRRISAATGNDREGLFLFRRLSVILQRFNAILSHQSLAECGKPDLYKSFQVVFNICPFPMGRPHPMANNNNNNNNNRNYIAPYCKKVRNMYIY